MKKIVYKIFAMLFVTLMLVSCEVKKEGPLDECLCFMNYHDAMKYAQKVRKPILAIITANGEDYISEDFINEILMAQEFDELIAKDYVIFHADFSQKSFERTAASESASEEEKIEADLYGSIMQSSYQIASVLNVSYTPALYLITKEGYVISEVDYQDEILEIDSFKSLLDSYKEKIQEMNDLVKATKKGSDIDKARAIHNLYISTNPQYRTFLNDLAKTIPTLDPENKTGLVGQYIFLAIESTAISHFTNGDIGSAVQVCLEGASHNLLSLEEKQECYYTAAFLLAQSGSEDFDIIIEYLRTALAIAPNSPIAGNIHQVLDYFTELLVSQAYEAMEEKPELQLED